MKDYLIKKGRHYTSTKPLTKLYCYKNQDAVSIDAAVCFNDSCKYNLQSEDQHDINKLIGYSFGLHHKNSDRIGWRYVIEKNQIEILLYSYSGGKCIKKHIDYLNLNETYMLFIETSWDDNARTTIAGVISKPDCNVIVTLNKPRRWGYLLTPYFGGNQKAPHDITIKMKYDYKPYKI